MESAIGFVKAAEAEEFPDHESDVFEYLDSKKTVYRECFDSRRWWDEMLVVVEIKGQMVGYVAASTTGDNSPSDVGWEFDESSVCFVEPYQHTETRYKRTTK